MILPLRNVYCYVANVQCTRLHLHLFLITIKMDKLCLFHSFIDACVNFIEVSKYYNENKIQDFHQFGIRAKLNVYLKQIQWVCATQYIIVGAKAINDFCRS